MRLARFAILTVIVIAFGMSTKAGPAFSEVMEWQIKSNATDRAQIKFYSQHRSYEWPGPGRAWNLDDYQWHTFRLNCLDGEKICYGAWVRGDNSQYWGVGQYDRHDCRGCCGICGRDSPRKVLEDD